MPTHNNPLAEGCEGCWFLGLTLGECNYLERMEKRRPCPGGKGCKVKTKKPPKEWIDKGGMYWDANKGKALYDKGATDAEIAKLCHASITAVKSYRKRHWGLANCKSGDNRGGAALSWDAEKGLQLWLSGMSDAEVAKAVGTTAMAVRGYRQRKWMHLKDQRIEKKHVTSVATWDTEKGYRMWLEGASSTQIGKAVGVTDSAVRNYARRHWRKDNG